MNRIDPDGREWYSYEEEYEDENGEKKTRKQYKYVRGKMSEKEMEEGGYTYLGATYDNGDTYYSLGGGVVSYDNNDPLSVMGINRLKFADGTVLATVAAFDNIGNFWERYNNLISTGSDAASLISQFMNCSQGFQSSITGLSWIVAFVNGANHVDLLLKGDLKGAALNDAIVNLLSVAGPHGAALSLYYNNVAKPGAEAIIKYDRFLNNYFKNAIIKSNQLYGF